MAKLLIEDDDETAEEILADLRHRGHEAAREASGPDGLAAARRVLWDVLVVDRLLPGCDGLAVLQALRRDAVRTPALVLSALGDVDERVRGLRAGGEDYPWPSRSPWRSSPPGWRLFCAGPRTRARRCCAWGRWSWT